MDDNSFRTRLKNAMELRKIKAIELFEKQVFQEVP